MAVVQVSIRKCRTRKTVSIVVEGHSLIKALLAGRFDIPPDVCKRAAYSLAQIIVDYDVNTLEGRKAGLIRLRQFDREFPGLLQNTILISQLIDAKPVGSVAN